MDYCISSGERKFSILFENKAKALKALKAIAVSRWVTASAVLKAASLEEAMDEFRWPVDVDDDTSDNANVIDIYFSGEKLGNEDELFEALGPFVEKGSYVTVVGEDGNSWRYYFDGKKCAKLEAKVSYG